MSWLRDSSGVVTAARRHDTWDRDLAIDLYVVPLAGDGARCLTGHDGRYSHPSVSPDGQSVAFVGYGDTRSMTQNAKVGILPTDSENAPESAIRWISAGFDRTFETTSGSPAPVWESDTQLLAVAEDRGRAHLYRLPADGSFVPAPVTDGPLTVTTFDAAAMTLATARSTVTQLPELYLGDERRTRVGVEFSARLLGWEKFTARTTDGTDEIDAWIMRPADFDETRRYPVLLNVHGGPFGQYGEHFFDEFQMQAAAGFVVVLGNPRGGSGRHSGWAQAILGPRHPVKPGTGWGSVDVDDVLAIIDTALDRYDFCDPDRVGMLGGSYGGFMATWLAAFHSDRFRAFCSERAVNNLTSEEWSSRHLDDVHHRARRLAHRRAGRIRANVADTRRAQHRQADADHPLRERLPLPDRSGRGALGRTQAARKRRRLLSLPRRGPRAVTVRVASSSCAARRDHPRLVPRQAHTARRRVTSLTVSMTARSPMPSNAEIEMSRALSVSRSRNSLSGV